MKDSKEKDWFDSPRLVTYVIIGLLIVLIILSQSFAINSQLGTSDIIRSILNHNSIYVLTLIYFVLLHFKVGKKYFDHLNVLMLIFFGLITIASMFTVFQSFGLISILQLVINILFTIYFLYAFISNTVIGKDLHLNSSPIVELKNEQYFYLITTLLVIHLVVALINSHQVSEAAVGRVPHDGARHQRGWLRASRHLDNAVQPWLCRALSPCSKRR